MRPPALGVLVDQLWALEQKKKAANLVVTNIEGDIEALKTKIYAAMDQQQTTKAAGGKASISIGSSTVFQITDYDELVKFVGKTKYFHLFHRRISDEAAREIFAQKVQVPGLTPFVKRKINLTTTK